MAQLVLISEATYGENINEIGDIVGVFDGAHQFSSNEYLMTSLTPIFYLIGILVLLLIFYKSWAHFSPAYNFLWGDYLAVYEKRRSRGKFILIGVVLTIVLGIITIHNGSSATLLMAIVVKLMKGNN